MRKIKVILPENIRIIEKENLEVTITTDKTEYGQGETVKIIVRNGLDEIVCFESCNTYSFQRKNGFWKEYLLKKCLVNFITECINHSEIKEFEANLFEVDFSKGVYRIVVSIYTGCQDKEFPCEGKEIIYSNEFTIKEKAGEITCNEKCKSSGYVSGVCKSGSGAIVDCGTDAVSIGQTLDCKLVGETGGTWKSCCCNK